MRYQKNKSRTVWKQCLAATDFLWSFYLWEVIFTFGLFKVHKSHWLTINILCQHHLFSIIHISVSFLLILSYFTSQLFNANLHIYLKSHFKLVLPSSFIPTLNFLYQQYLSSSTEPFNKLSKDVICLIPPTKMFDPDWVNLCCSGRVSQPSLVWVWVWKISP